MIENKSKKKFLKSISQPATRNADTLQENIIISPIGDLDSDLIGLVGQQVHRKIQDAISIILHLF